MRINPAEEKRLAAAGRRAIDDMRALFGRTRPHIDVKILDDTDPEDVVSIYIPAMIEARMVD